MGFHLFWVVTFWPQQLRNTRREPITVRWHVRYRRLGFEWNSEEGLHNHTHRRTQRNWYEKDDIHLKILKLSWATYRMNLMNSKCFCEIFRMPESTICCFPFFWEFSSAFSHVVCLVVSFALLSAPSHFPLRSVYNDAMHVTALTNGSRCPKGRKAGDKLRAIETHWPYFGKIFNFTLALYLFLYGLHTTKPFPPASHAN